MALSVVYVWLIRLAVMEPAVAALATVLDSGERARAEAMPAGRRSRFVVAHGAARLITGQHLAVRASRLRWERGPHGKPELAGTERHRVRVNLSHSGGLAIFALTGWRAIGVDVEQERRLDATRLAARFFPPEEASFVAAAPTAEAQVAHFTRLWTRKEACLKAAGSRLVSGLAVPVQDPGGIVRDPGGNLPGTYLVQDVPVPEGYAAAVALAGTEPFQVVRRWWQPPA